MDLFKVLALDVGVYLRCGDIGMAEEFLHDTDVGAPFKEVCGKRVPKRMRGDMAGDTGSFHVLPQYLPVSHTGEWRAEPVEEEYIA